MQCVATREILTGLESMELNSRFGTATLTQIVKGAVTRKPELDTLPKQNTEIVSSGEMCLSWRLIRVRICLAQPPRHKR